jgi:hypothetical protein
MTKRHKTRSARRLARRAAGGLLLASGVALGSAGPAAAVGESVTVTPDANLPDTATVNVSGTGFPAHEDLEFYQCVDESTFELCSVEPVGGAITNASGAFGPATATVRAVFQSDFGPTECRTGCRIRVEALFFPATGRDDISFARYSSK